MKSGGPDSGDAWFLCNKLVPFRVARLSRLSKPATRANACLVKTSVRLFALSLIAARLHAATVLVEAESFKNPGGWVLDTQFIESMGSPYLMAHGLGEPVKDSPIASVVKRVLGTGEQKIKVRGIDDVMVFLARCCNPIRGEKIVGYITRGKGVSVHAATCTNVLNLLYAPERRIDVEWDGGAESSAYSVRLKIRVEDRKGILADLSTRIADINTNIRDIEATTDADDTLRFTIGRVDVAPGSPNTVPGKAIFTIDMRHPRNDVLESHEKMLEQIVARRAAPCPARCAR